MPSTAMTLVQNAGRCNPVMITSGAFGNPNGLLTAETLAVRCNVLKTSDGASWSSISSCRWYIDAYTLAPESIQRYRDLEVSTIEYNDLYQYSVAVSSTGNFNSIITNGIQSPEFLVVIPFFASSSTFSGGLLGTINPYQSPFDPAPACSSPYLCLKNFNVLVNGSNAFSQNVQYDHDMYMSEVSSCNALNGGKSTGLTSGLIDQLMWSSSYRYYVCDLSRRVNPNEVVSLSIQGTVNSVITELMCFVVYKKTLKISRLTGNPIN